MSSSARILPRLWVIAPACALGFLAWSDEVRVQRVEHVSGLVGRAHPVDVIDSGSPTGYPDGQRELIVPEANESSFQWIAQTQQMLARGEARVRRVDFENAPEGHEVNSASPYRWCLGLVAWMDHEASGRPIGVSVERAAVYANPLLHLLLVAGAGIFAAWRFGGFAGALLSIGLAALFPLSSGFLPGMPDQSGLADICAIGSILILLAGMRAPGAERGNGSSGRWFALAGVVGGLGMWVSVQNQVPIAAGIVVGALFAACVRPRGAGGPASVASVTDSWRIWAWSGGATVLLAYLAENAPDHMGGWRMDSIHPLYALAWIGAGELLARAAACIRGTRQSWGVRGILVTVLAAAAVAAPPFVMWRTQNWGFLARDLSWARLTWLPGGAAAASTRAWLFRDGATLEAWATLLPLITVAPAAWLALRPSAKPELRASLAVALGPVVVALGFACERLSWWNELDCALLALVVAAAGEGWSLARVSGRWILAAITLTSAVAGAAQLSPRGSAGPDLKLTPGETEGLVERHLAHWLAKRTGEEGAVVFAPPAETAALCFYGSLRGIGTFAPDNIAGFGATLAIASSPTMDEAQDYIQGRQIRYVVLPLRDPFFDNFAKLYLAPRYSSRPNFFAGELRSFRLPLWLRPVPYQAPLSTGNSRQPVLVFEVVAEQSPAAAASRLAEYLVEMGDLERAAAVGDTLQRFPGDVSVLAARAHVQFARGDTAAAAKTVESLVVRLSNGGDRYLPWDRRVSLAIVAAEADRIELSRDQARRCFGDVNEARLRSLSTGSLFGLLVLGRSFGLEIADPRLRGLSLDLLPGDLRSRF
ncbi:MAG TPA: hypothetical protein VN829_06595 [Dongiaceae bacterium]|nr:hypothetical protein [Dongiaceae bacterium]